MRAPLQLALAAAIVAGATSAHAQMRYQAMDTNRDGVITRNEWRGTDRAFRNDDWNGDGVLSGDLVGARRKVHKHVDARSVPTPPPTISRNGTSGGGIEHVRR